MSDTLLRLYHASPYALRVAAASLRGYYLRRWRFGPETEAMVEEILERDRWSTEKWNEYRTARLAALLERASRKVPYYRDQWARRRAAGDRASPQYLENWPILEKDSLRVSPEAFVADGCNPRRMMHVHTSGTTGKPLSLWRSRETMAEWYALFEARCRRWYGFTLSDRWAVLGGQLVAPVASRKPPFWVWNAGLSQLYMSTYHLAPDLMPAYRDAIRSHRIRYLWGYTSALHALAQGLLERGERLPLELVQTNAEPVFDYQRRDIEEAFECSLSETYGMVEICAAGSECEAGTLHGWPEVGWLETANGKEVLPPTESGELLATGLLNQDMPLIRYRVGDRYIPGSDGACACGRHLPPIGKIEGRQDDVLYTVDGRRVGRLDPVFKAELPLREAQIVQEALDRILVRVVPGPGWQAAARATLTKRIQDRLGPVEVTFEELQEIPRGANGKFRAVVSVLSSETLAS
jgi:phenylacetate-CoA ligase